MRSQLRRYPDLTRHPDRARHVGHHHPDPESCQIESKGRKGAGSVANGPVISYPGIANR
jgi:hypothetical protein